MAAGNAQADKHVNALLASGALAMPNCAYSACHMLQAHTYTRTHSHTHTMQLHPGECGQRWGIETVNEARTATAANWQMQHTHIRWNIPIHTHTHIRVSTHTHRDKEHFWWGSACCSCTQWKCNDKPQLTMPNKNKKKEKPITQEISSAPFPSRESAKRASLSNRTAIEQSWL